MRRLAVLALVIGLALAGAPSASASTIDEHCHTRWQPDDTDGLNWCATLGYNDTTGEIRGMMFYNDDGTGNVYQIYVRNVILWRLLNGNVDVKDSCQLSGPCPDYHFVYDDVNGVGTDWDGWQCDRAFSVEIRFQVEYVAGGPFTGILSRSSSWVQLC